MGTAHLCRICSRWCVELWCGALCDAHRRGPEMPQRSKLLLHGKVFQEPASVEWLKTTNNGVIHLINFENVFRWSKDIQSEFLFCFMRFGMSWNHQTEWVTPGTPLLDDISPATVKRDSAKTVSCDNPLVEWADPKVKESCSRSQEIVTFYVSKMGKRRRRGTIQGIKGHQRWREREREKVSFALKNFTWNVCFL